MIIILNEDLPIDAARKIIKGTNNTEQDIFSVEDLKEIADYLYTFCKNNKE